MSKYNQGDHDGANFDGLDQDNGFGADVTPMHERTQPAVRAAGPSNTQVLIWSLLGLGALGYLGVTLIAPDLLRSSATAEAGTATFEQTRQDVVILADEVTGLKQAVDAQNDIVKQSKDQTTEAGLALNDMQQQVANLAGNARAFEDRLQQLETAKGGKQAKSLMPAPAATTQAAAVKPQPSSSDSGIDGLVIDAPAPLPVKQMVKAPAKSVAKVAVASPPTPLVPKPAAATKPFGVELAMSTSPEALRLSWELLNEQHGPALQGLTARSAPSGENFRLLAGPFANVQQANAACAKLKQQGLACKATAFVGSAL